MARASSLSGEEKQTDMRLANVGGRAAVLVDDQVVDIATNENASVEGEVEPCECRRVCGVIEVHAAEPVF